MKVLVLLGTLLLLGFGITVFVVMRNVRRPPDLKTVWSASSGNPVPDHFCFLAMPRDSNVVLYGANGKPTSKKLERALICRGDELADKEWVAVWDGDADLKVLRKQLVFAPTNPDSEALVANWKKTVKSWGRDTDWPDVDVVFKECSSGIYTVELRRTSWKRRDTDVYTYNVSGESVTPQSWQVSVRRFFGFF